MYHFGNRCSRGMSNDAMSLGASHDDVGARLDMAEHYFLAVDVGTSRVGAATARVAADGSITAAVFALGRRSDSVVSAVFVGDDGDLLFGDSAERRGVAQPERLVREFKRSIGDEVPLVVGGRSFRPEEFYALTVAEAVRTVTEREGAEPAGVILSHPATWGPHRIGLVRSALEAVGLDEVDFITEPEAAARHYDASRALGVGETLAVYDLGGGTFDCVVLRKTETSFAAIGEPVGLDNVGGADFDDAVFRHVLRSAEVSAEVLDDSDADARVALAQVRRECVEAKEALSFDSDAVVPVMLPAAHRSVRLTRAEFEGMIDPFVAQTTDALEDALERNGIHPDELEAVLLIGGSSRIPLITQRLSEQLDRPIAIDADPKSSVALGAAHTVLVRAFNAQIETSDALVLFDGSTDVELASATEIAAPAPAGVAQKTPPSVRHTVAVSAGALLVAAAIVFGSTLSAGQAGSAAPLSLAWYSPATGLAPAPAPTGTTPVPAPPVETASAPVPVTNNSGSSGGGDSQPRRATPTSRKAPPASSGPSNSAAPPSRGGAAAPAPAPGSGTTNTNQPNSPSTPGGGSSPSPSPSNPSADPSPEPTIPTPPAPDPTPTETTPPPQPEPTPDPTPEPEPSPTTPEPPAESPPPTEPTTAPTEPVV